MRMTRPQPRTLAVKAGEALHALQMETRLTKPEILSQYLNRAPFGGNLAGVEAACRAWFGKSAAQVSLAEAALLMGLPQSPGRLRPDRNPEGAAKRRDYVLARMEETGAITADERAAASATPVEVSRSAPPFLAPHLCDLLLRRHPGVVVRSTLDTRLQAVAEHALRAHSEKLGPRGIHGGAVIIVDVPTSSVVALAGSPDYFDARHAGQVNGATARRAPGSTLKPFVYLEAFDRGLLTPDSVIADVPVRYAGYEPANFDHQFRGPVSVREALVASLNIPALKTLEQIGLDTGLARLRAAGLQSLDRPASHYGISLALGSAEVTLLELAEAYAALARLGEHRPLRLCDSDPDGPATRIASPGAAWLLADVLSGPERALQASGHMADTEGPRYAWKTGTSMGHRDAWTVAYGPRHVVAVWDRQSQRSFRRGPHRHRGRSPPGRPHFPPARSPRRNPVVSQARRPRLPPRLHRLRLRRRSPLLAHPRSPRPGRPHRSHSLRHPSDPPLRPRRWPPPQARRRRPRPRRLEGRRSLAPRSRILARRYRRPHWDRRLPGGPLPDL
jgi:penicillin-binding protein 1C